MPAVGEPDHGPVVRQVEHDRGDEVLPDLLPAVREFGEVALVGRLQRVGQPCRVLVPVRDLAEGREQRRRVPDRPEPLAADVPDQQPGGPTDPHRRVQIAADVRFVGGGQVAGGESQRPGPVRQRAHQDALHGVGDAADPVEFESVPFAHPAVRDHDGGDEGERDDLRLVVGGEQAAVQGGDDGLGDQREHADQDGQAGAGERRGDRGRDDQQRAEVDGRGDQDVDDGDQHDQAERQQHHQVSGAPLAPQSRQTPPHVHPTTMPRGAPAHDPVNAVRSGYGAASRATPTITP